MKQDVKCLQKEGVAGKGVKWASVKVIGRRRERVEAGLYFVEEDKLRKSRSRRKSTKDVEREQQREHFGVVRGCNKSFFDW